MSLNEQISLQSIQFHVYSDDEVRNLAAVQVTNCSTYDRRVPKSNGLNDIRMGVNDPHLICPTCGLSSTCSNHYGFIELEKPVIRIGFLNNILQLLKCVCWACSRPKFYNSEKPFPKDMTKSIRDKCVDIKNIKAGDPKEFLKLISEACKKKMICPWEECDNPCGLPQCHFTKHNKVFLKRIFSEKAIEYLEKDEEFILERERLFPDDIKYILANISHDTYTHLGFDCEKSHPQNFIMKALLVPPPNIRPANVAGDTQVRCENDITLLYQNVIRANTELKLLLDEFHKKISHDYIEGHDYPQDIVDAWDKVQILTGSIINQNLKTLETYSGKTALFQSNAPKRVMKDIKSRLCGKRGRLRANLSGKRVDHAARTVIGPDSSHDIFQLGVPSKIMNTLTIPEIAANFNIELLRKKIIIGANEENGALSVKIKGNTIYLHNLKRERKEEIAFNLPLGACIERHLVDGDWVVFNRQPTLHKASIMAFKAYRVGGYQFKLSLACTRAFNADFDGDEMNLHALQDYGAIAEAQELMAVPHQIVTPQNNNVLISLVQDGLLGAYKLSNSECMCTKEQVMQLCMNIHYDANSPDYSELPIDNETPTFDIDDEMSGKQVISLLFPKTFTFFNGEIEIRKGIFIKGTLTKKHVGTGGCIIRSIWQKYGPWASAKFISDLQRLCVKWLEFDNECISIKDCLINLKERTSEEVIALAMKKTKELHDLKNGILSSVREARQTKILQETRREIGSMILENMDKTCGIANIVSCGAKGNEMNIAQISGIVGQQIVCGARIPFVNGPIGPRTLAAFSPWENSPAARGFISNSYIKGLNPQEFFYHQQAGREGVVATAVQTADAGYNQRRMIKNQESEVVGYDKTVRGSSNNVLQFKYGGDDYDGTRISKIYFNMEEEHYHLIYEKLAYKTLKNILDEKRKFNLSLGETDYFLLLPSDLAHICKINNPHSKNELNILNEELLKELFLNVMECHEKRENIKLFFNLSMESKIEQFLIKNKHHALDDPSFCCRLSLIVQLAKSKKGHNEASLKECFSIFLNEYRKGICIPGEGVGAIGSSCIGEPSTQMTLNVFHHCGIAEKNVTLMGLPRFKQLIDAFNSWETANMQISFLRDCPLSEFIEMRLIEIIENCEVIKLDESQHIYDAAKNTFSQAEILGRLSLLNFLNSDSYKDMEIKFDMDIKSDVKATPIFKRVMKLCGASPKGRSKGFSSHAFFYTIKKEELISKNIRFQCICDFIVDFMGDLACVTHSMECDSDWIIMMRPVTWDTEGDAIKINSQFCEILMHSIIEECIVNGIEGIKRCIRQNENEAQTDGSNFLDIVKNENVDSLKVITNNVIEVYNILGVEAAGLIMQEEFQRVLGFDGSYVDPRHTWLLTDTITHSGTINPLNRFKMEELGGSILQRASFEQTLEVFEMGASFGGKDFLAGSTERMVVGQPVRVGTGCFSVYNTQEFEVQTVVKPLPRKQIVEEFEEEEEDTRRKRSRLNQKIPKIKSLLHYKKNEKDENIDSIVLFFKELCSCAVHKNTARISMYEKSEVMEKDFALYEKAWESKCSYTKMFTKVKYKDFKGQEFKAFIYQDGQKFEKTFHQIDYKAQTELQGNIFIKLERWNKVTEGSQDDNVKAEKTCIIIEKEYKFPNNYFKVLLQKKWKGDSYQNLESHRDKKPVLRCKLIFDCPWETHKKFTVQSISNDMFNTFKEYF
jgi:DNA-directed RNA polymerase II subunit RPB1